MVIIKVVINVNKKYIIVFLILLIIGLLAFFIWSYSQNGNNNFNYEAEKTANNETNNSESNHVESSNKDNNTNNVIENSTTDSNTQANTSNSNTSSPPKIQEEILSTFSTKIYSTDSSRQNNITLTCSKLNGTTVKNGATFSFCNTIGPSSTNKGYQKADIFDSNGNKKKGLGGGNCQVSTTLYNAILTVPSLTVTERHEHSNYVPYIQEGKDAAVAYGSYDLKFVNNSGNDIKITAATDANAISISIVALKSI